MAYQSREQKDNSGILFRNEDKQAGNPSAANYPDAKGRAMIGGVQYWVSAWTKLDRNGNKYQSLSFKAMDRQEHPQDSGDQRPQRRGPRPQPQQPEGIDPNDPSIPF